MSSGVPSAHTIELDGRTLHLTSLDRVLWPRTGFTKSDLIDYYQAVAPALLPHLASRPVTLGRWPQGVHSRGFAQTECRGHPSWLATAALRLRDGDIRHHCLIKDAPALTWAANLATIEFHAYPFRFENPDAPTLLQLDLDPGPGVEPNDTARAALLVRETLAAAGLAAFAKTSGSAGLHVHVPLGHPHPAGTVKTFAADLAAALAAGHQEVITDDRRPAAREGKTLLDWTQAQPRRLMVAPYSLRATPEPAVSTPITWSEVASAAAGGDPLCFGPSQVMERVAKHGELFASTLTLQQTLPT